jgi:hypothetical protein
MWLSDRLWKEALVTRFKISYPGISLEGKARKHQDNRSLDRDLNPN